MAPLGCVLCDRQHCVHRSNERGELSTRQTYLKYSTHLLRLEIVDELVVENTPTLLPIFPVRA